MFSRWKIHPLNYLETEGAMALVFSNLYEEGKQGGLELIHHGLRVLTNGNVRLEAAPDQWAGLPKIEKRTIDRVNEEIHVKLYYEDPVFNYTMVVRGMGHALQVLVNLDEPLPEELVGKISFNVELLPSAYMGLSYQLGITNGIFPRQVNGPVTAAAGSLPQAKPLATGHRIAIASEDPERYMSIESNTAPMQLLDGRAAAPNGWFVLRCPIPANRSTNAISWYINPGSVMGWVRPPVICHSQVGYHPKQQKKAIVELDPNDKDVKNFAVQKIGDYGSAENVLEGLPEVWGQFLYFKYATFDFSAVQTPGLYRLAYGDKATAVFRIHKDVYQKETWQPTLETFLPVQMCHMAVRDGYRLWHGACHLDDALQAPTPHEHFDGYRQKEETDSPFQPYEHIPHLDRGGWHDAGDYDLAAGSQAGTTFLLALTRETFGLNSDQTSVDREARLVQLHTPDGVPDIVEQVAHGVESLLSGYRAVGHSFAGIIENCLEQYVHLGDAATMTDNQVYQSANAADPQMDWATGVMDDRWAFTNRDTALEYMAAGALAAASRILRGFEEELAEESLQTALKAWTYEQTHDPVKSPGAYVPWDARAQEILAAVELLLATGDRAYLDHLYQLWDSIEERIHAVGWSVARLMPQLEIIYQYKLEAALINFSRDLRGRAARNPFGLPFDTRWMDPALSTQEDVTPFPMIWGIGWNLQQQAVELYFLQQAFPHLFDADVIQCVLNYVYGAHPASDTSLVGGVGTESLTIHYGINRAEWSYVPGGVVSGPNLIRPWFPELMDPFPFLWQQKEYVIGGAASYLFLVLAVDRLVNPQ